MEPISLFLMSSMCRTWKVYPEFGTTSGDKLWDALER